MLLSVALVVAAAVRVDAPIVLTAQAPASAQETSLVPWFGPRVGYVDNVGDGSFVGGDGALFLGLDTQGTAEIGVTRLPVLLEGRGLYGARLTQSLFSVGGYGYAGGGVGGGLALFNAFDDSRASAFGLWVVRGGGGVELGYGSFVTRVEAGLGLRDLRFELSGSFAVAAIF